MKPTFTIPGLGIRMALALAVLLFGLRPTMGGSTSEPPSRQSVLKIEEGYVDTGAVLIYYTSMNAAVVNQPK